MKSENGADDLNRNRHILTNLGYLIKEVSKTTELRCNWYGKAVLNRESF